MFVFLQRTNGRLLREVRNTTEKNVHVQPPCPRIAATNQQLLVLPSKAIRVISRPAEREVSRSARAVMPRCSWIKTIVTREPSATTLATYAEAVRELTACRHVRLKMMLAWRSLRSARTMTSLSSPNRIGRGRAESPPAQAKRIVLRHAAGLDVEILLSCVPNLAKLQRQVRYC